MRKPSPLGSLQARFARLFEALKPANVDMGSELAFGGTYLVGGIIHDDHKAELRGRQGMLAATKMRRSDAQVRCVEQVLSLPIRSTVWSVEPPEDPSADEREAAQLLQENLFGGMEGSFDDLLREACLAIYYGFRVPEIVWEERGGLIAIKKIASRNPDLVERWLYDPNGRLAGYLYVGNQPTGEGVVDGTNSPTQYRRIPVPIEKTVHFVYSGENDSPQGFGLWRSMHPHWYIKQAMYKVIAVGIERNLLDVPVGRVPVGSQQPAKDKMLQVLRRWRAAEDAAVVLTGEEDLEFKGASRALMDAMPFLDHQDVKILQAGLCAFLNLGQGSSGTQALATQLVKMFEISEDGNASWIEDTLNRQLLRRWTMLNYGPDVRSPKLKHKPIRSQDIGAWGLALQQITTAGYVHPTPDDEAYIRDTFELPAIPLEQLQALADEKKAADAAAQKAQLAAASGAGGNQPPGDKKPAAAPGDEEPRQARERIDCDACGGQKFSEAERQAAKERQARDAKEQSFTDQARTRLEAMEAGYLKALRPLVEQAESAAAISKGKPLADLAGVDVPGATAYRDFVAGFLFDVMAEGRAALASETGQDVANAPVPNRLRSWVRARAAVIAKSHVSQLQTAVLERVLTGVRAELPAAQIFTDAGAVASLTLTRITRSDWGEAAAEVLSLIGEAA